MRYPLLPKVLLLLLVEEQQCKSAKRSTKSDKRPERVDNLAHSLASQNYSRRCPSKRHPNRLRHSEARLSQYPYSKGAGLFPTQNVVNRRPLRPRMNEFYPLQKKFQKSALTTFPLVAPLFINRQEKQHPSEMSQEANRELARLWRVSRTVHEMVRDRVSSGTQMLCHQLDRRRVQYLANRRWRLGILTCRL